MASPPLTMDANIYYLKREGSSVVGRGPTTAFTRPNVAAGPSSSDEGRLLSPRCKVLKEVSLKQELEEAVPQDIATNPSDVIDLTGDSSEKDFSRRPRCKDLVASTLKRNWKRRPRRCRKILRPTKTQGHDVIDRTRDNSDEVRQRSPRDKRVHFYIDYRDVQLS